MLPCRLLIETPGCDIDSLSEDDCTPVYYATLGNQKEIVAMLVGAGGRVNDPDLEGVTPLHGAAQFGYK